LSTYSQTDRPLKITTPLGPDILLITGLQGHEEISHLFEFDVRMIADLTKEVKFDAIIGQSVTVEMRLLDDSKRFFNGIVKRFSQGARDESFMHFRAHIVPKLWFLSKKIRSRVFQHLSVPDILKQVLTGLDVNYDLTGTYYPRDYCIQYQESDFNFISRLMEEEGIYYFFKHTDGNHQMMVTDNISKHPAVPGATTAIYEEAHRDVRTDMRVTGWEKIQEIRSGACTLWDHSFELPGNHLEAKETTIATVPVGKVTHKLNLANDALEIYNYPGRYAQRFDGIDPGGGDRPADIQHIFDDRTRTVRLRMEQEEVAGILIEGTSDCGQFTAGHKFTLQKHFDADASYLLMRVTHEAHIETYRSDQKQSFKYEYQNHFTCIPEALRFRPQRVTPVPKIAGVQTATVVGPSGEDVWVDKYGRVKVQFHWDREGKMNADSSCWIRVSQVWAGKGWGAFFWPRIGHEVVVVFEEGDPDQPLIIGSVYNHDNMPWFTLPHEKDLAGFKSASIRGSKQNYNGIIFVDRKGQEHLSVHSERHMVFNAEIDKTFRTGRHSGEQVPGARTTTVGRLPGTGGSGGGGPDENLYQTVEPAAILGMNSVMVYGANVQNACPLNFQVALGNNLQICVNPWSFNKQFSSNLVESPDMSPALTQLSGGGLGGNMSLTLGTNTQVTLGQSIQVVVGPRPINVGNGSGPFTCPAAIKLGLVIEIATIVFYLAYPLFPDDDLRALLTGVYQLLIQVLMVVLMDFHMLYHTVDEAGKKAMRTAFYPELKPEDQTPVEPSLMLEDAVLLITLGLITPLILESTGEEVLDITHT
jgi:type VI secretion system secreted protein VgrG